ncbi:hypothetical protein HDV00_007357 [Rhizophlyctis rosea]|nr:hypothetical protein HDV00_007357 [Rhizophlyctis rosea]
MKEKYDVMISYCWPNKPQVAAIKDALVARGYRVWYDENRMGEVGHILDGMEEGLTESKVVCVFLSVPYTVCAYAA